MTNKRRIRYYLTGYGIPLLVSIYSFAANLIGPSGNYCWLKNEKRFDILLIGLVNFIIGWIIIVFNFIYLYKINNYPNDESNRKYINQLCIYPITHIICLILPTTNRIFIIITKEYIPNIDFFQILIFSLQTVIYSITYLMQTEIRKILYNFYCAIFCCCEKTKINATHYEKILPLYN